VPSIFATRNTLTVVGCFLCKEAPDALLVFGISIYFSLLFSSNWSWKMILNNWGDTPCCIRDMHSGSVPLPLWMWQYTPRSHYQGRPVASGMKATGADWQANHTKQPGAVLVWVAGGSIARVRSGGACAVCASVPGLVTPPGKVQESTPGQRQTQAVAQFRTLDNSNLKTMLALVLNAHELFYCAPQWPCQSQSIINTVCPGAYRIGICVLLVITLLGVKFCNQKSFLLQL